MRSVLISGMCVICVAAIGVVSALGGLSNVRLFQAGSGVENVNLGATDVKIASGVINCDAGAPWKLTITSANNGTLVVPRAQLNKIPYTSITLVRTGGTLGAGLTDPSGTTKSIASGTCEFTTGSQPATKATVNYAFELRITWAANESLVAGNYSDTITMTFSTGL